MVLAAAVGAQAVLDPPPGSNHLLGWKAGINRNVTPAGTPFPKGVQRTIVDQFGSHGLCDIKREKGLYNPANKNGEGIVDLTLHAVSYRIRCPVVTTLTRTYFDQFFPGGVPISILRESHIQGQRSEA